MSSKILKVLSICALLTTASFHSQNAEAAAGFYFSSKATKITGGIIAAVTGSYGGYLVTIPTYTAASGAAGAAALIGFTSLAVATGGLVILDDNNAQLNYLELSIENAKTLNISNEDRKAYNNDLELINAIQDDIQGEVGETDNLTVEQTSKMWHERLGSISEGAQRALVIISSNVLNQMQK